MQHDADEVQQTVSPQLLGEDRLLARGARIVNMSLSAFPVDLVMQSLRRSIHSLPSLMAPGASAMPLQLD